MENQIVDDEGCYILDLTDEIRDCAYLIDIFKLIKNILKIEYSWNNSHNSIIALLEIIKNYPINYEKRK